MNATQATSGAHRGDMFDTIRDAGRMAAYAASWPLSHLHCKVIARGHDPVVFPDGTGMCRRCYRPLTQ